jgi:hypothetical protein
VVDYQRISGQDVLNVFQYIVRAIPSAMAYIDFALAWVTEIQEKIRALQGANLQGYAVGVRNLTNGIEYEEYSVDSTGSAGPGELMPSFVAAPIKLGVTKNFTRPGGKRIGGLLEDQVQGDVLNLDGPAVDAVETALGNSFTVAGLIGDGGTAYPVILRRLPGGGYDPALVNFVTEAIVGEFTTSQVSRRI